MLGHDNVTCIFVPPVITSLKNYKLSFYWYDARYCFLSVNTLTELLQFFCFIITEYGSDRTASFRILLSDIPVVLWEPHRVNRALANHELALACW
jgi:hypothetical protein